MKVEVEISDAVLASIIEEAVRRAFTSESRHDPFSGQLNGIILASLRAFLPKFLDGQQTAIEEIVRQETVEIIRKTVAAKLPARVAAELKAQMQLEIPGLK